MADVPVEKRFRGQARLVKLLLWRQGESTELDVCFERARKQRFINEDDERFLRSAFEMLDQIEAGEDLSPALSSEMVDRLQACVNKLNSADSA